VTSTARSRFVHSPGTSPYALFVGEIHIPWITRLCGLHYNNIWLSVFLWLPGLFAWNLCCTPSVKKYKSV